MHASHSQGRPGTTRPASPVASEPGRAAASCAATVPNPSAAAVRTAASLSRSARPSRPSSLPSSGGSSMARQWKQPCCVHASAARARHCLRLNWLVLAVWVPAACSSVDSAGGSISWWSGVR